MTARISDLSAAVAAAAGIPRKTVDSYVAYLRRDRLLPVTVGGRGNVGGAKAAAKDAAILLIALLGSEHARNAVEAVHTFGPLFYAGCGIREVLADGEHRWRLEEELAAEDPLRDTFQNVLTKAILWFQTGYEMLPGALPISQFGISGNGATRSAFLEAVIPKTFDNAAMFAIATFTAAEEDTSTNRAPIAAINRGTSVNWRVLPVVAEALGRIANPAAGPERSLAAHIRLGDPNS